MSISKHLLGEKTMEEVSAIVIAKEFIPSRVLPVRSLPYPTSETYRVYLRADIYQGYIDDKTLYDSTKIGDDVQVSIIKKYSSKGKFMGFKFSLK